MRILVVAACPLPWPRGTPIRIHRMSEALAERGHEVHVVTYPLGDTDMSTAYRVHRVGKGTMRVPGEPGPSISKLFVLDPLLVRRIRRLQDEAPFDVVHAHHYEGVIAALLARRRGDTTPVVFDVHTLLGSELHHYRLPLPDRALARIGRGFDRSLPRRADGVIAVTERMRDWLVAHGSVPKEHITLIPNGVEQDHFCAHQPSAAKDADGAPARIVFSGNLAEYQGIDLMLTSFCYVLERRPDARLVLVTDADIAPLSDRLEELGIAGHVSSINADYASLPARLSEADVLVNPRTDCDGIPQKLLNYMAVGRPIVSFAGSAALLRSEQSGLVVEDEDTEAFGRAVLRVLEDPDLGKRLGRAAQAEVLANHGWQNVAEKVERVYASVTAGTTPGKS